VVAAAARRYRESDIGDVDRASPDHVRASGLGRPAECIELLDAIARSIRPCRVTGDENAGAVVPFADGSAGVDTGARRAWPGRRKHADQSAARIHAGPCACPRRRSCRLRCFQPDRRSRRPRRAAGSGFKPGAGPQGVSQASRPRTNTGSAFKASADEPRRRSTPMRSNWSGASFRDWPPTASKSIVPWSRRARGSRWAMRSAPLLGRA